MVISIIGAACFYMAPQNKQHKLTSGIQGASINSKSTHLAPAGPDEEKYFNTAISHLKLEGESMKPEWGFAKGTSHFYWLSP